MRTLLISALIAAAILTSAVPAPAEVAPAMTEVRYIGHASHPGFTRLVFEAEGVGPSGFRINYVEAGGRVVFYPIDGLLALTFAPVPSVDALVRGVDFVQEGYAKRGIAVKLGPGVSGVRASRLTDPDTLVLDIYSKGGPKPFMPYGRPVRTIAIDPGHGGAAQGPEAGKDMAEDDLVLDVALRLRKLLAGAGYKVVLTRDKDAVSQPDVRAGIANNARADLFVSLHESGSFGGAEAAVAVYTMDAGELGTKPVPGGWPGQNAPYLPDSIDLADGISKALEKLCGYRPDVRQARLAGFPGLAMPAVLVEMGPVTAGGGALAEDAARDRFAQQLAAGINRYARGEGGR